MEVESRLRGIACNTDRVGYSVSYRQSRNQLFSPFKYFFISENFKFLLLLPPTISILVIVFSNFVIEFLINFGENYLFNKSMRTFKIAVIAFFSKCKN